MKETFTEQDIIGFTLILGFCTALLVLKASSAFREKFDSAKRLAALSPQQQNVTPGSEFEARRESSGHGGTHFRRPVAHEPPPSPHDPSRTVLIVDDDPLTRHKLRTHLEKLNLRLKEAPDGPAAVQLYKDGMRFCMIVMDYEMPEMTGLDATRKIRAFDNDVVIVGSTIHDPATKQGEFLRAGANCVEIKPISAERLGELVAEYNLTATTDES